MVDRNEPLIRVMALHALAYCERLFYLEEVDGIRVADDAVYAGRNLHEEMKVKEIQEGEWRTMEVSSDKLGIVGKLDCLRRSDGELVPYEHKRGRARKDGRATSAWPADALQVSAYGMLVEEETGRRVTEGRVRYHKDNVTVRVPLDEGTRRAVHAAVKRSRELRSRTRRPPITPNDGKCIRCSLSPVCLPEEERLAADPAWEPVRLFPPDRDKKTIHVTEPGSRIGRSGQTLVVRRREDEQVFPIHDVGALVIHGYPQITTQAVHFCAGAGIPIHFLSTGGGYLAGTAPGAGGVQRRLRQFEALSDRETRLQLARRLAMAKTEAGLRYLLRAGRKRTGGAEAISEQVESIRSNLKMMSRTETPDQLRGYEGAAGRAYFSALGRLIRDEAPKEMRFTRRSRRPPRDRFNALLGFGYALLYQAVYQAILAVGLEASLGVFHTPRSSAYPLVLDMMELFRTPIWDMVLLGSVNRLQWDVKRDFSIAPGKVWLSSAGRKKAITLFERRLEETWKHPVVKYSLSYARIIELEVRLLEKEWSGSPGLFARMRLR